MADVIYDLSRDTRIREAARMREKAMHDEASALYNAKKEGLNEGMTKGINLMLEQIRAMGIPEEQIREMLKNADIKNS